VYFWKIESLKRDLIAGALSERERLHYLLWLGGVTTAAYAIPLGPPNVWDHAYSVVMVLGFILGTVYLYYCNHGRSGSDFLTRYVSLSWVFGIRFTVLVSLPTIVAGLIAESLLLGAVPEDSTFFESALSALLEVGYFMRLGRHFSEVSSSRVAA
jgi:hypothetical protein